MLCQEAEPSASSVTRDTSLLLVWQDPTTRRLLPVGRVDVEIEGDTWTFRYLKQAHTLAATTGFRGFAYCPDLNAVYTSTGIPSYFQSRTFKASKNNYVQAVTTMGLNPSTATPLEQLIAFGGTRQTDTFQFVEIPHHNEATSRYVGQFLLSGVRHLPGQILHMLDGDRTVEGAEYEAALRDLGADPDRQLHLVPEPRNPHDASSLLVVTRSGVAVGWVPSFFTEPFHALRQHGDVNLFAKTVNPCDAPFHLRVIVGIDTPTYGLNDIFDRDEWRP